MGEHPLSVLYGEYDLAVDDKSRLLIPAEVRRAIDTANDGEAFFLVVGVNQKPWMYPDRAYERMALTTPGELTPAEDLMIFDQLNFGMASKLEPDKQGRVLLPEKTIRRSGLKREVTMIGVRDHLELWNRDDWETWQREMNARRAEIFAKRAKAMQDAKGQ